jgi:hypothetical protein
MRREWSMPPGPGLEDECIIIDGMMASRWDDHGMEVCCRVQLIDLLLSEAIRLAAW